MSTLMCFVFNFHPEQMMEWISLMLLVQNVVLYLIQSICYLPSTKVGSICYKMTCLVAIIIGKPKKATSIEIERGEILTSLDWHQFLALVAITVVT